MRRGGGGLHATPKLPSVPWLPESLLSLLTALNVNEIKTWKERESNLVVITVLPQNAFFVCFSRIQDIEFVTGLGRRGGDDGGGMMREGGLGGCTSRFVTGRGVEALLT